MASLVCLLHGTNNKCKRKTKNKLMSMVRPVHSHYVFMCLSMMILLFIFFVSQSSCLSVCLSVGPIFFVFICLCRVSVCLSVCLISVCLCVVKPTLVSTALRSFWRSSIFIIYTFSIATSNLKTFSLTAQATSRCVYYS